MIQRAVVKHVRVSDDLITFELEDGRHLSAPTSWSHRLSAASKRERDAYEIESGGMVVAWPKVDEHIGVWSLLGVPEDEVFQAAGLKVVAPAR